MWTEWSSSGPRASYGLCWWLPTYWTGKSCAIHHRLFPLLSDIASRLNPKASGADFSRVVGLSRTDGNGLERRGFDSHCLRRRHCRRFRTLNGRKRSIVAMGTYRFRSSVTVFHCLRLLSSQLRNWSASNWCYNMFGVGLYCPRCDAALSLSPRSFRMRGNVTLFNAVALAFRISCPCRTSAAETNKWCSCSQWHFNAARFQSARLSPSSGHSDKSLGKFIGGVD